MLVGIFGTGRNGSTMLTRLLDGVPGAYVHPVEVNFLSAMDDLARGGAVRRDTVLNATTRPLAHLDRPVPTALLRGYYESQVADIRSIYLAQLAEEPPFGDDPFVGVAARSEYRPAEFVPAFLRAMQEWLLPGESASQSATTCFFKTIETPYVGYYETALPDMKFVHLIRDPVATYSSAKRTLMYKKQCPSWYLAGDNLRTMIRMRWLPHARWILARRRSDQHRLIRFEDLIADPQGTIGALCNWLGLSGPAHADKQTVLGGQFMKRLPPNASQRGVETPVSVDPELHRRSRYQEVLTQRERDLILHLTYDEGRRLGYFAGETRPDAWSLARAWTTPEPWEFRHTRGPLGILRTAYAFARRRASLWMSVLSLPKGAVTA